mgnify:CR=1 FL=1
MLAFERNGQVSSILCFNRGMCFTYLDIIPYLLLKVVMSISFRDKLLFLISFEFSSRQMLINITCLIFC